MIVVLNRVKNREDLHIYLSEVELELNNLCCETYKPKSMYDTGECFAKSSLR